MKILVTGASGFVGQHLISVLKDSYSIIGTVNDGPPESSSGLIYEKLDVTDKTQVFGLLNKHRPDAIVHLAAISTTWSENPEEIFKTNFDGTFNIYDSIVKIAQRKPYSPKVIFASSGTIYGKAKNPKSINEDTEIKPLNFYSTSKSCADRLSYQYSQSHKLKVVVIRSFNLTGPGQNLGFFVPDMCSQIAKIEKYPSKNTVEVGNLDSVRDFLDVRDAVLAYKALIEIDYENGEVFNLCSGVGRKMEDVLNTLISLSNKEVKIKVDPLRIQKSDIPIFIGNNQKLKRLTGWKPRINFDQTLKETLEYWREKQKGIGKD